ncbi:hypothetical protein DL98DRAFT_11097 [Cadophora sp. DSE1049]|nr:hypothetical protein DL98DRAFT_11097 [Cadophora sp. DSE1049]
MCTMIEVSFAECGHVVQDRIKCKRSRSQHRCYSKPRHKIFDREGKCVRCREVIIDWALRALDLL